MNSGFFIIRLNWVDCITLSGFALANIAIYYAVNHSIDFALAYLFLAVLADAFDGVFARKFNLERDFGRYLDSFVDCSIYLAVPCVIWHQLGYASTLALGSMLIFLCAGIIRLAVFNDIGNLKENSQLSYLGLPVFWSAFIVAIYYSLSSIISAPILNLLLTTTLLVYALLMLRNSAFYKPTNKLMMLVIILSLSIYYFYRGLIN